MTAKRTKYSGKYEAWLAVLLRPIAITAKLITETNPEIVIVGTPDHWHALPTIMALDNGAHVYVEKPIGHTINEGKAMVAAARRNGKVVQVGTHRRVFAPQHLCDGNS